MLKKTILYSLVLAMSLIQVAKADIWEASNSAGGKIVLDTGATCTYNGESFAPLHRAYSRAPDGVLVEGCFLQEANGDILVTWHYQGSAQQRMYDPTLFIRTKKTDSPASAAKVPNSDQHPTVVKPSL